jgi:hypothetical protein
MFPHSIPLVIILFYCSSSLPDSPNRIPVLIIQSFCSSFHPLAPHSILILLSSFYCSFLYTNAPRPALRVPIPSLRSSFYNFAPFLSYCSSSNPNGPHPITQHIIPYYCSSVHPAPHSNLMLLVLLQCSSFYPILMVLIPSCCSSFHPDAPHFIILDLLLS